MIWREQINYISDCYFCMTNVQGFSKKNKHNFQYPNLASTIRPVSHCPEVPIPILPDTLDYCKSSNDVFSLTEAFEEDCVISNLGDLMRNSGLSKLSAQLLRSRLHEKNFLAASTTFF